METVKFKDIKPAAYNPRRITETAFKELQGSLKTLGFILPIIVNKDNMTIVAGHQRTKAATAIGLEEAPCYYVSGIDIESEIMFNQIHNGVELEPSEHSICLKPRETGKFYDDIPVEDFEIKDCVASVVKDMCQLMVRYGDALCVIVIGNEVVFGNNYLQAAKATGFKVHAYFLDEGYRAMFDYYFKQDYGVFNYEHIEREDFVQGLAQPPRHGGIDWSVLYREIVPYLTSDEVDRKKVKILDFGCGKAMFITKLRKTLNFKNAIGLEFFNHNTKGISIEKGNEMIDNFIATVKANGKFDVTICDAVVNSVNTQEAEDAVFACLNLFTKMGGRIYASGRSMEFAKKELNLKRNSSDYITVKFFDENGLTAIMREGQGFFQKFLTPENVDKILEKYGFKTFMRYHKSGYWGFGAFKTKELTNEEYAAAVDYEFNLKLPNNKSYNRHEEVKELFGLTNK